ncbi:HEAT repeat domain-containing protein [Kitasatospora herbaricolor]|uniref:HEAT repeat domain-containing protein n=1 Tax=Kitasatospora herbaricolor TaxID=68217 RepID=A0ABZ1WAV2_9ACTN|nr:HEAT repeat domain-containing protein [Kitasatospora herbaricolor]
MSTSPPDNSVMSAAELLEKLSDPERSVRNTAALAIGSQSETGCADVLVDALWAEQDFFVRETMTWAVTRLEEATRPTVLAAVGEDRPSAVRVQALHVVSKFANPETVDAVLPFVTDPDEAVARKARWALGRIKEPRAVPHLLALLGEQDSEERNALTDDVAAFGSAAVPALVEALGSDDHGVRRHAADVLCYIGHPDAEDAAEALGAAVADPESPVAMAALMALGELRGEVARTQIEAAREAGDPRVRGAAERLAARKPRRLSVRARSVG